MIQKKEKKKKSEQTIKTKLEYAEGISLNSLPPF